MANPQNQEGNDNVGDYCFERHPVLHPCTVCGDRNCPGEVFECVTCGEKNICSSRKLRFPNPKNDKDIEGHQKTVNGNPMVFCGPIKRIN